MKATFRTKRFAELSSQELYENLRLRAEVFVVEQDCVYQDLDNLDQQSWHLMQYLEGSLIGYTRLLPPGLDFEDAAAIGRVVTHPSVRRKGYGRPLMKHSIELCEQLFPGENIKLHAQSYLLDFYGEFGFIAYGEEFLEDGIPHYFMVREVS